MKCTLILALLLLTTPIYSVIEEAQEEFFPSTPEQIATLSIESNYLIGGVISPLIGHPVLKETDMVVKGAQNIVLSRIYIPPYIPSTIGDWEKRDLSHHLSYNYKGWQFYPHLKLKFNAETHRVLLTEPNGMSLQFFVPGNSIPTLDSSAGISNMAGDPNPHQHEHLTNSTGGTPSRSKIAKPVPEWLY